MANYTELRGLRVKYVSSNPSPAGAGEVWYNTTDKALRAFVGRTAWSAGGNLITGRNAGMGSGTQTAALVAGGGLPPGSTATEEYNGSGWAAGGTIGTARGGGGSCGTQTSSLIFGGTVGSPNTYQDKTELYNGSSWSEQPDISTARYNQGNGVGTSTAALYFGGYNNSNLNNTEEYDGSSWTNGPTMNTGRANLGTGGTQTAGIGCGGYRTPTTGVTAVTETWDGTSWTEVADLATARRSNAARNATSTAFLAFSGPGHDTGNTEEFNNSFQVVTAGAWASGGNLPVANKYQGGGGTQTAGIATGGQIIPGSIVGETYEYDGSAWTDASADMGNSKIQRASCGTQTANLVAGGQPDTAAVEEYNGTSWAEQTDIPEARDAAAMTGIQTAAIFTGGDYPNGNNNAETFEYDGSSWTDGTDIPTAVRAHAMFGTQSAAVVCGGYTTTRVATTYEWDDSSWTTGGNMITARYGAVGCGTQTDGLIAGGDQSPYSSATEGYDGSVWSTRPSMATAREMGGEASSGPSSLTMGCGGVTASAGEGVVNTEEFTGDTAVDTASAIDFD